MKKLTLAVCCHTDTAAMMAVVAEKFGSLEGDRLSWGRVLHAAGIEQLKYSEPKETGSLAEELEQIAVAAVPEEGDPHPQRAMLTPEGDGLVTPGGVSVCFSRTEINIDFGRDSRFQAARVIAALADQKGDLKLFELVGAAAGDFGPEMAHVIL